MTKLSVFVFAPFNMLCNKKKISDSVGLYDNGEILLCAHLNSPTLVGAMHIAFTLNTHSILVFRSDIHTCFYLSEIRISIRTIFQLIFFFFVNLSIFFFFESNFDRLFFYYLDISS